MQLLPSTYCSLSREEVELQDKKNLHKLFQNKMTPSYIIPLTEAEFR